MINLLGDHGPKDRDIVCHLLVVGKEVRNILARFPVFFELGKVALDFKSLSLKLCDGLALGEGFRHGLSVKLIELWFVVESFEMRWPAGHAEKDDALGLGCMVRKAGESWVFFNETLSTSELGEKSYRAEGESGVVEESTAIDEVCSVHGN